MTVVNININYSRSITRQPKFLLIFLTTSCYMYFQLFHLATAFATRDQVMGLTLDYRRRRDFLLASTNHDIPSFVTSIVLIVSVLIADVFILTAYTTWMYHSGITSAPSSENQKADPSERNGAIGSGDYDSNRNNKEKGNKEDTKDSEEEIHARKKSTAEANDVSFSLSNSRKRNLPKSNSL